MIILRFRSMINDSESVVSAVGALKRGGCAGLDAVLGPEL
jgi:hypothetical protein